MAVIKENGITKRLADCYHRQRTLLCPSPAAGLFRVQDLLDCSRRAVMRSRESNYTVLPRDITDFDWRYLFRTTPGFEVVRENASLADGNSQLSGFVDIVASYNGEMFLVKIISGKTLPEDPLKIDVTDMVVCMYLAAVWHGILIYRQEDGNGHSIHFLNPDRRDSKKILGWAAARALEFSDHILHETTPSGETGEHCSVCPFRGSCDKYLGLTGATENGERDET